MTITHTKPREGEKLIFELYEYNSDGRYAKHICYLILGPDDYVCFENEGFWGTNEFYYIRLTDDCFERIEAKIGKSFDYRIKTKDELKEEANLFKKIEEEYKKRVSEINVFLKNMNKN